MFSRIVALEELRQREVMFWLPPGGRYNGVWASTWVALAELAAADVAPLLKQLHDADVGGYAASSRGQRGRSDASATLYVDRDQLPKATDVVMGFLRGRTESPPSAVHRPARKDPGTPRSASTRTAVVMAKILLCALAFAGVAAVIYAEGEHWVEMNHQKVHVPPSSHLPGVAKPGP